MGQNGLIADVSLFDRCALSTFATGPASPHKQNWFGTRAIFARVARMFARRYDLRLRRTAHLFAVTSLISNAASLVCCDALCTPPLGLRFASLFADAMYLSAGSLSPRRTDIGLCGISLVLVALFSSSNAPRPHLGTGRSRLHDRAAAALYAAA